MILFSLAVILIVAAIITAAPSGEHGRAEQPLHVRNAFAFTLAAPHSQVAPLFGADGERVWATDNFDPHFVYPQPARDQSGAVFQLTRGPQQETWITTVFDPQAGHMQHVCFVPDSVVTLIDIHVSALSACQTRVQVVYERTALRADLNEYVRKLGEEAETKYGPEWQHDIEHYLASLQSPVAGKTASEAKQRA